MKNFKLFIIAAIVALAVVIAANMDKMKDNLSWIFEDDESHMALPELSNREIEEAANKNKEAVQRKRPAAQPTISAPEEKIDEGSDDKKEPEENITND